MNRRAVAALAFAAFLQTACSSGSSGMGGGGGPGGKGGGGVGGGGGTSVDAGAGFRGYVSVQTEASAGGSFYQGTAYFDRAPSNQRRCQITAVSGCESYACQPFSTDGGASELLTNAGPITISGGAATVTLAVVSNGGYSAPNVQNVVYFRGGETLSFSAPGNPLGVGAFVGTVVAPTIAVMNGWAPTPTVNRSQNFSIGWSTGGAGVVETVVSNADFSRYVSCTFARSALTASIPGAALQDLPAGQGRIDVVVEGTAVVRAGDWDVRVAALRHASTADGGLALETIMLQ